MILPFVIHATIPERTAGPLKREEPSKMKRGTTAIYRIKGLAVFLLFAVMTLSVLLPVTAAYAQKTQKTVRVGWYESPFNITDEHGRRSGYAYEYQRKISAYTGWEYEYVEGTWPDLMQMLVDGEIDLMSDVSYTEERAEIMLYPDLPMGAEQYFLFIDKDNHEISPDDFSTLNGKRVGANKGSVQINYFKDWEKARGVHAEIVELTNTVEEALNMLQNGEIDVYLALDSYGDPEKTIPISYVGSSDFYFAVSKKRPDLLDELNFAMSKIHDEDSFYNEEMYETYNRTSNANLSLTTREAKWLEEHGTIRVGYQDNYLAFCAADESGTLTGALKDYLELAQKNLENENLSFETAAYPTASEAIEALKKG